jgi:hypothetical protein
MPEDLIAPCPATARLGIHFNTVTLSTPGTSAFELPPSPPHEV